MSEVPSKPNTPQNYFYNGISKSQETLHEVGTKVFTHLSLLSSFCVVISKGMHLRMRPTNHSEVYL